MKNGPSLQAEAAAIALLKLWLKKLARQGIIVDSEQCPNIAEMAAVIDEAFERGNHVT